MSTLSKLRYRSSRILRKVAKRIVPTSETGISFPNIGKEKLPISAPRALIIFSIPGPDRYLRGAMREDDPFWSKHTVYWESVELIRQLNAHGYIVDYADNRSTFAGDWNRYDLVLDGSDNLRYAPKISGQTRIHYTTYIHWLTWNRAELERIAWFRERTGILIPSNRQLPSILSDEYADHLTYYGTQLQADSFSSKPTKQQLNISAVFVPDYQGKEVSKARKNFIWLGGGGIVHKGLDIAMEAFAKMPHLHLYIAGNPKEEPRFWDWAEPFLKEHPNIHLLGWMDVASPEFHEIASACLGIVYPSAAEGGPGSVAQALHWGLIPIVTKSALVRAEHLGSIIRGQSGDELISSTKDAVLALTEKSDSELETMCDAVNAFAKTHHTRSAYTESVSAFLDSLTKR